MRGIGLLFLALFAAAPAMAADVAAPPQWSSDQVRAARPAAREPALTLDVAETGGDGPVQAEHVTLAPSFTLIEAGGKDRLYDHALCRVLSWRSGAASFHSDSCYAGVAFRVFELRNRQTLARMLAHVAPGKFASDPAWDEAELGFQDTPVDRFARRTDARGVEFRLGETLAVRLDGPMTSLSAGEAKAFVRFLATEIPLHPQVRRELMSTARMPATIEVAGLRMGKPFSLTIRVTDLSRTTVDYALPAGMRSDLRTTPSEASARTDGIRATLAVIDGSPAMAKPSAQSIMDAYSDAMAKGHSLEAMLRFLEFTQLYGPWLATDEGRAEAQARFKSTVPALVNAPDVAPFWAASTIAGQSDAKPADREAAAKYLATTNLDALPFGTFRYVTFANLVNGAGDATAKWEPAILRSMPPLADGIWRHIARYPWAGVAYKDLGDTYMTGYQMDDAWLAYDLGRSVDRDWRAEPLGDLGNFEDRLRTDQPDFF